MTGSNEPSSEGVSVVIPSAGKRHELLRMCLGSILRQNEPHEILVVVPPGRSLPTDIHRLTRVVEQEGSISAAVNAGIRESRNSIIAVTHDDCRVSENWLREISQPLFTTDAIACVGQTIPSREGRAYPTTLALPFSEVQLVRTNSFQPFWDLGLIGNNFALRRNVMEQVGPFNERLGIGSRLRGGEDLDMFHRILAARLTVCVNPRAVVYHEPLDTWSEEMRMMYTYRVGLAAYFYCHFHEPDVGNYFVKHTYADQVRQVWRALARGRFERMTIEAVAMLGLSVGLAKSLFLRPNAPRSDHRAGSGG